MQDTLAAAASNIEATVASSNSLNVGGAPTDSGTADAGTLTRDSVTATITKRRLIDFQRY